MYEFRILDPATAPAYERLTFPMFRSQFRSQLSATHRTFCCRYGALYCPLLQT
jgi:hypothetical protein